MNSINKKTNTMAMKYMKWLQFMICSIILCITSISNAQQVRQMPTPEQRAKGLQKVLKLTDEQTAKITAVYREMDKERTNDKATQAKLKNWSAAHNTKAIDDYMLKRIDVNEARINPILTADQKKAYHTMADKARTAIKQREAKG